MSLSISIHAPARGATWVQARRRWHRPDFNPRSRTGSDSGYQKLWNCWDISIHAPARGATNRHQCRQFPSIYFNPRSRTGSDVGQGWHVLPPTKFQSTLPHGERPNSLIRSSYLGLISIHAPARGATESERNQADFRDISIHAPARGATLCSLAPLYPIWEFQSTLPHGERRYINSSVAQSEIISIHAPARGATRATRRNHRKVRNFNPRSRTGSDAGCKANRLLCKISIHAPARGATKSGDVLMMH